MRLGGIVLNGGIKNQSIDVVVRPSYFTIMIIPLFIIMSVGYRSVGLLVPLAIIDTLLTIKTKEVSKKFMAFIEREVRYET